LPVIGGRAAAPSRGSHLHFAGVYPAGFARLILLRRELRRSGGDLCLRGLHDRVRGLYEINRLQRVLPLTP
jgi:hypothetical protein